MKRLLFVVGLILGCISVQAQENLRWGITGGLNVSKYSSEAFDFRPGFHAGVKAELALPQLTEGVYLDMEALFSMKGAKINGSSSRETKLNPFYLEIPVHIGYKYALNDRIAVFGNFGPYFGTGLFGKIKEGDYDENLFGSEDDRYLKRFDFGLGLKGGIEFNRCFQLSIGYDWGLIDLIDEGENFRNRNLMISASYLF